jgi:hypothetical protein
MFQFCVGKDMKYIYIYIIIREVGVGKVTAHLCVTLLFKEF